LFLTQTNLAFFNYRSDLDVFVCVGSETIDTPANRGAMPDADHSSWTPPSDIAARLSAWAQGTERVDNGDAFVIATRKGATEFRKLQIEAQK
jgi:hypothetical protein